MLLNHLFPKSGPALRNTAIALFTISLILFAPGSSNAAVPACTVPGVSMTTDATGDVNLIKQHALEQLP